VKDTDLFDLDRALTPGERKGLLRRSPVPRGYVMPPGTGPEGETCGSCKHLYRNQMSKVYLKCNLNRAKWTGGGASDIRAKSPACKKWERA
jgi:hypothetical protein